MQPDGLVKANSLAGHSTNWQEASQVKKGLDAMANMFQHALLSSCIALNMLERHCDSKTHAMHDTGDSFGRYSRHI